MIVGSVGSGIAVGMASAVASFMGGHPLAVVFLTYALVGSVATLGFAAMCGRQAAGVR